MSGTTFVLLLFALAMSVPITKIICNTVLKLRELPSDPPEKMEDMYSSLKRLGERITVLETIITDNRYQIEQEIDGLCQKPTPKGGRS